MNAVGSNTARLKLSKSFDTGHRAIGFVVYPPGFWSCFGPEFYNYGPFLPFEMVIYISFIIF